MVRKYGLLTIALLLSLVMSASAQEVELKWKLKKGDTFYQTMTVTTQQKMTVTGQDVTQTQAQTFTFEWKVEDDKEEVVTLAQSIVGLTMNLQIGETNISYNPAKGEDGGALKEFFETLSNAKFKITVDLKKAGDPKAEMVTKVEGRKELADALIKNNPQMKELVDIVLAEKALKEMAAPIFSCIPGKKVKKDEEWKRTTNLSMGPIGTYDTTYTYKYVGKEGENEKISVKTELTYTKPKNAAGSGLPFTIKEADLKSSGTEGTILFDAKAGRLVDYKLKMTLKGKLEIEIGGQVTEVTLDQTQDTTMKISTTNPVKPE